MVRHFVMRGSHSGGTLGPPMQGNPHAQLNQQIYPHTHEPKSQLYVYFPSSYRGENKAGGNVRERTHSWVMVYPLG